MWGHRQINDNCLAYIIWVDVPFIEIEKVGYGTFWFVKEVKFVKYEVTINHLIE